MRYTNHTACNSDNTSLLVNVAPLKSCNSLFVSQSKRRKTFGKSSETSSVKPFVSLPVIEDPVSEDDEQKDSDNDESDPDWVSGNTPAAFEKRAVSRVMRGKVRLSLY